jgi:hypothetical protein
LQANSDLKSKESDYDMTTTTTFSTEMPIAEMELDEKEVAFRTSIDEMPKWIQPHVEKVQSVIAGNVAAGKSTPPQATVDLATAARSSMARAQERGQSQSKGVGQEMKP